MKRLISLVFTVVVLSAVFPAANAGSRSNAFQDPLHTPAKHGATPASSPLLGVARAGGRLIAVGQRGDIVFSSDQGKTWSQAASVPVSTDLTAVDFPSARQGWAVGQNGVILHSTDGGKSWAMQMNGNKLAKLLVAYYQKKVDAGHEDLKRTLRNVKMMSRAAPALALLDVWFRNDRVGYVVGEFNIVLKTVDGGRTWTPMNGRVDTRRSYHLYSIVGTDKHMFIAGEQGQFLRFDPKKQMFEPVKTPYKGSYFGVAANTSLVVIYGLRGHAYTSRNAGKTWHRVRVDSQDTFAAGVIDHGRVVLTTITGEIFVSNEQGRSFHRVDVARPRPIYGIAPARSDKVVLVGATGPWVETLRTSK